MMLTWPEIQNRLDSECGNIVAGSLEGASPDGVGADDAGAGLCGAACARKSGDAARHSPDHSRSANAILAVLRLIFPLRSAFRSKQRFERDIQIMRSNPVFESSIRSWPSRTVR